MNIVERYELYSIIQELEVVLQIDGRDFEERDMDKVIRNVKTRINQQYMVDLTDQQVDSEALAMGPYRGALSVFIDNVTRIHGRMCGYGQIARYLNSLHINVGDINYLGFTIESLQQALIVLQRKRTLPMAADAIEAIKDKLSTVNTCFEKRLFILLVVSYELGFKELSATIAEILYLSIVR